MKTILLASRKGGSGKTTLLAHLAVQAMHEGEDVTIVDLDPQQNLKAWWDARAEDGLKLAQFPVAQFAGRLVAVRNQPGFLLVDTPGFEAAEMQPLLEASDFVVIPVQPTPNDLRAVGQTVQAVKRRRPRQLLFRGDTRRVWREAYPSDPPRPVPSWAGCHDDHLQPRGLRGRNGGRPHNPRNRSEREGR